MGEIGEIAKVHFFKTNAHSDKALGMTRIWIRRPVQILHVINL